MSAVSADRDKPLDWRTKAAAFRVIDGVPFGPQLHFLAQRYVTRNWPRPQHVVVSFVEWAQTIRSLFEEHGSVPFEEARFLEIGAGRDLAMPLALRALGAGQVASVDIDRLAKLPLIREVSQRLSRHLDLQPPNIENWDDLRAAGIRYEAPFDATRALPFEVDAFISNEVLEHIPADVIPSILGRVATAMPVDGLAIHSIDYSDHFARGADVSRYNFLKYSDEEWRPYNTSFQYVNRLRHSDYLRMFETAGFAIVDCKTYSEIPPADVMNNLADRFRRYASEDIGIMRSTIVARRK